MSSLEYMKWNLAAKKQRWDQLREVLATPWTGDRGWEGRTIGLHLPLELRNFAVGIQERLGLKSMKEVLFKAIVIGLKELDSIPATPAPKAPLSSRPPRPPTRVPLTIIPPPPPIPESGEVPVADDDDLA